MIRGARRHFGWRWAADLSFVRTLDLPMRILIVKLSSLGDIIHTLPAAQLLRAAFPRAWLGWAVEKAHAAALHGQPWLDETIVWDRRQSRQFLPFLKNLRRTRWDVAIDFQGLFRSGLATRASGAKRRVGYVPVKEMAHWFYTDRVERKTLDRHAVDRYLDLAAYVAGEPLAQPGPASFPLYPTIEDVRAVDVWLAEQGFRPDRERLVVLNPHCRKEANRWPAERFAELARRLLERPGLRVALTGGAAAKELCDRIAAPLGGAVWRADGKLSILGSAELYRRASLFVTGDTGPMHVAAAVGAPIVAIFGPANPVRTGPYTPRAIVLDKRLACAPCFARRCPLKYDPPLCLDRIGVDEALAASLQCLAGDAGAPPSVRIDPPTRKSA